MQGKLIVFEGTDGSGKATQSELLCQELTRRGIPYRKLTFPRYQEESSALVRLYLGGAFGQKPGDVNAYAAAAFYSVDRYASYKQDWGSYYEQGGLLIADRYTTSNAVHQTSKLPPEQQRPFVDWLFDFEYQKLGLPAPDRVLYLDLPTELSEQIDPDRSRGITPKKVARMILQSVDALSKAGISTVVRRSNGKRLIELHRADSVDLEGAREIVPIDPVEALCGDLRAVSRCGE